MRFDETGSPCPSTLGEYRKMCLIFGGPECKAVQFLDKKIAEDGPDEEVLTEDSQMRMLLMPMLIA